jgi:hypothetical protein
MRSARLSLALETGALTLPSDGRIAVYRPGSAMTCPTCRRSGWWC